MDYSNLTFEDDKLERKAFVKNIMNIVDKWNDIEHENNSLVMSLDSPWGSGKSYLLNMWKNWLVRDINFNQKYYVNYYNAWENDDCDNAFVPLVYKLQQMDLYEDNNKMILNLKERSKEFLKTCGVAILKDTIKKAIGNETSTIIMKGIDDGIDNSSKKEVKDFFDKYRTYVSKKKEFKKELVNLIPDAKGGKLIVFVDELDRCRPTFAIETLEVIKHYFNIKDIVFIFAIDLQQLGYSIQTMYGNGMDSAGYLRRFFDINIKIPGININQYVGLILKDKVKELNVTLKFVEIASNIYEKLDLSIRDMDKITNNFIIFCFYYSVIIESMRSRGFQTNNILEIYLYFITLKYKYPDIYNLILREGFVAYDNEPKTMQVLEKKYFVSDNITKLLRYIQLGLAQKKDKYFMENDKYTVLEVNYSDASFSQHIEKTIEMFTEIPKD